MDLEHFRPKSSDWLINRLIDWLIDWLVEWNINFSVDVFNYIKLIRDTI